MYCICIVRSMRYERSEQTHSIGRTLCEWMWHEARATSHRTHVLHNICCCGTCRVWALDNYQHITRVVLTIRCEQINVRFDLDACNEQRVTLPAKKIEWNKIRISVLSCAMHIFVDWHELTDCEDAVHKARLRIDCYHCRDAYVTKFTACIVSRWFATDSEWARQRPSHNWKLQ